MSTTAPVMPPEAAAAQLLTQIATGHIVASALQVVAKLRVADKLASGPRSAAELATELRVNEDALFRVLRALAAVGVFEETTPRRFKLAAAGEMLRANVPGSMHDMALWITSPFHFRTYAELMHSVETGKPAAEKLVGMPVFEYFPSDPELSEIFNNAMTAFSNSVVPAALAAYDFSGIERLVDVAGGHGAALTAILQKYPRMQGVLFDLDHVVKGARPRIEALGLSTRCTIEAGDFFKAVPKGDGYVMKHIIHDWDDERAIAILKNIRTAMGNAQGRVILLESVLQPGNAPDFGKVIDLEMLVMPGGRERTAEEFDALFAKAGFKLTQVVRTEAPLSVIEARPQR